MIYDILQKDDNLDNPTPSNEASAEPVWKATVDSLIANADNRRVEKLVEALREEVKETSLPDYIKASRQAHITNMHTFYTKPRQPLHHSEGYSVPRIDGAASFMFEDRDQETIFNGASNRQIIFDPDNPTNNIQMGLYLDMLWATFSSVFVDSKNNTEQDIDAIKQRELENLSSDDQRLQWKINMIHSVAEQAKYHLSQLKRPPKSRPAVSAYFMAS